MIDRLEVKKIALENSIIARKVAIEELLKQVEIEKESLSKEEVRLEVINELLEEFKTEPNQNEFHYVNGL